MQHLLLSPSNSNEIKRLQHTYKYKPVKWNAYHKKIGNKWWVKSETSKQNYRLCHLRSQMCWITAFRSPWTVGIAMVPLDYVGANRFLRLVVLLWCCNTFVLQLLTEFQHTHIFCCSLSRSHRRCQLGWACRGLHLSLV